MNYGRHGSIRVIVIDLPRPTSGPDRAALLGWKEQTMKRKVYDSDLNTFEQACIAPMLHKTRTRKKSNGRYYGSGQRLVLYDENWLSVASVAA